MTEEKEEKGFVIRDKRQFTPDGAAKPQSEPDHAVEGGTGKATESGGEQGKSKKVPLPEITFSSFILSLSSSALFHFGDIPDPVSMKKERNLPLAKQTIDILGIVKEKTRGNLDKDEEQLLENLLHDLRLKYVEESKKG